MQMFDLAYSAEKWTYKRWIKVSEAKEKARVSPFETCFWRRLEKGSGFDAPSWPRVCHCTDTSFPVTVEFLPACVNWKSGSQETLLLCKHPRFSAQTSIALQSQLPVTTEEEGQWPQGDKRARKRSTGDLGTDPWALRAFVCGFLSSPGLSSESGGVGGSSGLWFQYLGGHMWREQAHQGKQTNKQTKNPENCCN